MVPKVGQVYDLYEYGDFVDKMTVLKVYKKTMKIRWHGLDGDSLIEHRDIDILTGDPGLVDYQLDKITSFNQLLDKYYEGKD